MKDIDSVLVVGGGPAGLSAAWALHRAGLARRIQIVEASSDGRPEGSGLLLTSPALRVLGALGLQADCVGAGVPFSVWQMFGPDDQPTGTVPLPNVLGPSMPASVGLSRTTLHDVLKARTDAAGIRVRTATRVVQLQQDGQGVDVVLSDGSTERHDMVIGADGLHSATREAVLPHSPRPRLTGQTIWRMGYTRRPEHDGYQVFVQPGTRVGLVPITATTGYVWMQDTTMPLQRPDPQALYRAWQERTAPYSAIVRAATDQARSAEQLDFRAQQNLIVPPPWHAGRVVLIGDAVHTTTPHLAFGVGLAFEDSFVLAEEIAAAPTPETAFTRFAERRFGRARLVVEGAQALGECDLFPGRGPRSPEQIIRESMAALAQPI